MSLRWNKETPNRPPFLFLVFLLIVSCAIYFPLSRYINGAVLAVLKFPLRVGSQITSQTRIFFNFQRLFRENQDLTQKVAELSNELRQIQMAITEARQQDKIADFRRGLSYKTITAGVAGKSTTVWTRNIIVNKGNAVYDDVLRLIELIQQVVEVQLIHEVRVV